MKLKNGSLSFLLLCVLVLFCSLEAFASNKQQGINSIAEKLRSKNDHIPSCSNFELVIAYSMLDDDPIIIQNINESINKSEKLDNLQKQPKYVALAKCIDADVNRKQIWKNISANVEELANAIEGIKPVKSDTINSIISILDLFRNSSLSDNLGIALVLESSCACTYTTFLHSIASLHSLSH